MMRGPEVAGVSIRTPKRQVGAITPYECDPGYAASIGSGEAASEAAAFHAGSWRFSLIFHWTSLRLHTSQAVGSHAARIARRD